jgi:hypothetical protein
MNRLRIDLGAYTKLNECLLAINEGLNLLGGEEAIYRERFLKINQMASSYHCADHPNASQ